MAPARRLQRASKVPAVTLAFWVIKIAATTLGETAGDALSMSENLGYAASTGVFGVLFAVAVAAQLRARSFHPALYCIVIVATTTVGTTMADFADRSLGIGYVGGSLILFACVAGVLALWRWSLGSVSADAVISPRAEAFYWATILFSNTLGTALGDFLADSGPGYEGGALVFAGALAVMAALHYLTSVPRTALFWAAFILTRPLGATWATSSPSRWRTAACTGAGSPRPAPSRLHGGLHPVDAAAGGHPRG